MIDQRINYIHQNPVRALIVAHPHEYLFSSALDYAGEKGYVDVQCET
jgi:putative transposase